MEEQTSENLNNGTFVMRKKLDKIFKELDVELPVFILTHTHPDPDAMASAVGMSVLLKVAYGLTSKIYHLGEVSHPQNRSMRNILHVTLHDGREIDDDNFSAIVVVDTDLEGTGMKSEKICKADLRVDHHNMDRSNGAKVSDVRSVGSSSGIVAEYLKEYNVDLSEHSDCATSLVLGIKSDTNDFTGLDTSELDMESYRFLLPYVNKESLSKVIQYTLPKVVFEMEAKAFAEKEIKNTTLVSFLGDIKSINRDVLSTVADRLIRMDAITTVVILGVIDGFVVASIRSFDSRVNVNDLAVAVFGKENAGGKDFAGGARLPLGQAFDLLTDEETINKVKNEVINKIKEKIFDVLGEHVAN